MGKIQKYRRGLSGFISSDNGQRFFNFAYSIGAAIVIWGALFKILHLPGGNFLLSLGMGTEVLMFILTAFDRPPREYHWEEVYPQLARKEKEEEEKEGNEKEKSPDEAEDAQATDTSAGASGVQAGGTVIISGGSLPATAVVAGGSFQPATPAAPDLTNASPAEAAAHLTSATQDYLEQISAMTAELRHLQESTKALNEVSDTLLGSYRAITDNSADITRSSNGYVEEMQTLNRNISGLNTIYEIQLKSVSSQLDAIDRVNRGIKEIRDMYERSSSSSERYCQETERMANYMQQLNSVYEKMIHAMTINMYNPLGAAAAASMPAQQASTEPQAPSAPASQPSGSPQVVPPPIHS